MAMYFTKDEISCPKCGNTILLKEEYVILKKTKNGLLPEKVKTKFICKDFPHGRVAKNPPFYARDVGLILVRELRSHMPSGMDKREEKN